MIHEINPAPANDAESAPRKRKLLRPQAAPRTHASFNVSGDSHDALAHEAARHGVTIGIVARDYALRLITMQREDALLGQGSGGDRALLHTQIAGLEKRMSATVTALRDELADTQGQLAVVAGLLDAFLAAYLAHTPSIPDEHRAERAESGKARYEKLLARVAAGLQTDTGRAAIVDRVQSMAAGV